MNANELRNKSATDLQNELQALLTEQFNLRVQKGVGQTSQTHLFKKVRRQIARIKMVLEEKKSA